MNYLHLISCLVLLFIVNLHQSEADQSWCLLYRKSYCSFTQFSSLCENYCGSDEKKEGQWTNWSSWVSCSKDCGGTTTRYRTCLMHSTNSGCLLENGNHATYETQSKSCDRVGVDCRVHGNWAKWSQWSQCSASCGNGQRFRSRTCSNPSPKHGGNGCTRQDGRNDQVEETQNEACMRNPCPIDGGYTEWSQWTECSATCGDGRRYRKRCCSNPVPEHGGKYCEGGSIISKPCQTAPCPVDGNWAQWTQWTGCDVTCGYVGVRKRFRNCTDPAVSYGGSICPGNGMETAVCGRRGCPVDGGFSEYTAWSSCSDACNGVQYRKKSCNNPVAVNGGKPCTGDTAELRPCKSDPDTCAIVPNIERVIVDVTPISPVSDTKIVDIPLIQKEYTLEGTITIADTDIATVGNIFTIETADNNTKGFAGPALDLIKDETDVLQFHFHINADDEIVKFNTTTGVTGTLTFKIEQYLQDGVVNRRISVDDVIIDTKVNTQPIETRDVSVYIGRGTVAGGVTVKDFKFYNNENKMCPTKADVLYIMDSSISVSTNFATEKDFVKQMARGFPMSVATPSSRGAAIVFSGGAQLQIRLRDSTDSAMFLTSLETVQPYTVVGTEQASDTVINKALELARDGVFLPELGDQVGVPNLVIMVLESVQVPAIASDAAETLQTLADEMRAKGINIFVVAVLDSIPDADLIAISGGEYNFIRAASWEELGNEEFIGRSLDMACRVLTNGNSVTFT